MNRVSRNFNKLSRPFYGTVLYTLLYIRPEDDFQEPKHVAVNYFNY